jgi:hypothetical protein
MHYKNKMHVAHPGLCHMALKHRVENLSEVGDTTFNSKFSNTSSKILNNMNLRQGYFARLALLFPLLGYVRT